MAINYGKRGLSYSERQLRNKKFKEGYLWCSDCQQFKQITEFWKWRGSNTNYGYRCYCRTCEGFRRKNKDDISQYYKTRNSELKQQFVELAGGRCQRCGYDEFNGGLDFHHIYREEKEHNPGTIIYSNDLEAAWQELDKCCLLCRNCHGGYTAGEWRAEFIKRDGLGWTIGKELLLDDKRYEKEPEEIQREPVPKTFINPQQMSLF